MVENQKISIEDQWEYWLSAGMLLYVVKHLCPNIANKMRELSKANNGAKPMPYKELLHVIKYVLDTKNLVLKIELTENSNKP